MSQTYEIGRAADFVQECVGQAKRILNVEGLVGYTPRDAVQLADMLMNYMFLQAESQEDE